MNLSEEAQAKLDQAIDLHSAHVIARTRDEFTRHVLVAPYDDRGVAEPGKEHGAGFAIFIGEWRIGWWLTRAEAAEEASKLTHAISEHPL
jgi:hypothetical protein